MPARPGRDPSLAPRPGRGPDAGRASGDEPFPSPAGSACPSAPRPPGHHANSAGSPQSGAGIASASGMVSGPTVTTPLSGTGVPRTVCAKLP